MNEDKKNLELEVDKNNEVLELQFIPLEIDGREIKVFYLGQTCEFGVLPDGTFLQPDLTQKLLELEESVKPSLAYDEPSARVLAPIILVTWAIEIARWKNFCEANGRDFKIKMPSRKKAIQKVVKKLKLKHRSVDSLDRAFRSIVSDKTLEEEFKRLALELGITVPLDTHPPKKSARGKKFPRTRKRNP